MNSRIEESVFRNAPVLKFHKDERYFPCSVEYFLSHSVLKFDAEQQAQNPTLMDTIITPNHLLNVNFKFDNRNYNSSERNNRFYMALKSDVYRGGEIEELNKIPCYIYIHLDDEPGAYTVWYWFLYAYNDWVSPLFKFAGVHEGDWEHVKMRYYNNTLSHIYLSAHGSSESHWHPTDVFEYENGHPVVYVARHSHAMYTTPGRQKRIPPSWDESYWCLKHALVLGQLDDYTSDWRAGGTEEWKVWDSAIILGITEGDQDITEEMKVSFPWLMFGGRWGDVTGGWLSGNGPHGPYFNSSWG